MADTGIGSDGLLLDIGPRDGCLPVQQLRGGGLSEWFANGAVLLVALQLAPSGARWVTDVGMEVKDSTRRKRMVRADVVVAAVLDAGVEWRRVVEDQLGLCPFPA